MNQLDLEQLLAPYPTMMTVQEVAAALRVDPRSVQHLAAESLSWH